MNRALLRFGLLLLGGWTATGCTTTQINVNVASLDKPAENQGDVYFLPRAEYVVKLDRELEKCSVDNDARLAPVWFHSQVKRLNEDVKRALNDIWLNRKGPAKFEGLNEIFEPAPGRIVAKRPEPAKTKENFEKVRDTILRSLIFGLLEDPTYKRFKMCPNLALDSPKTTDLLQSLVNCADGVLNQHLQAVAANNAPNAEIVVAFSVRANVTPFLLPDLGEAYVIDYQNLRKSLKKTEISVEKYPGGTLKSINSTIDDRTAEVIGSTIRGLASLYSIASGVPITVPTAAATGAGLELRQFSFWKIAKVTEPHICKNSVLNALSDKADLLDEKSGNDRAIARAVKVIDAASGQIGVRQAEIDGLEKKVKDQIGDVAAHNERIAKLKAEQVPYRDLLEAATKSKAALEQTNASVVANLESTRAKLTATTTLHFRPSEVQRQEEIGGAKNAADRWFNTAELAKACVVNVNPIPCDATHVPIELKAWIGAHVIVPMRNPDTTRSDGAGVVYREPARGALLVCKKLECLDANKQLTVIPENVVLSQVVDFPQLGVKAKLDLVNKAFQNNTLVAAFSEAGSLTRLEYKSNARAEKAAETFASSAESIQQLVEAKRDSKRKDLEAKTAEVAAETELRKQELELLKALAALDALRNPVPVPVTEGEGDGNNGQ